MGGNIDPIQGVKFHSRQVWKVFKEIVPNGIDARVAIPNTSPLNQSYGSSNHLIHFCGKCITKPPKSLLDHRSSMELHLKPPKSLLHNLQLLPLGFQRLSSSKSNFLSLFDLSFLLVASKEHVLTNLLSFLQMSRPLPQSLNLAITRIKLLNSHIIRNMAPAHLLNRIYRVAS